MALLAEEVGAPVAEAMTSPDREIRRLRSECGRHRARVRELEQECDRLQQRLASTSAELRDTKRTLALLEERLAATPGRPREQRPDIVITPRGERP